MKAAPKATAPSAKAELRKGTWSWTAPLELLDVVEEVELLEVEVEDLEEGGAVEVLLLPELLVDEFDAANVGYKRKKEENWNVWVCVCTYKMSTRPVAVSWRPPGPRSCSLPGDT